MMQRALNKASIDRAAAALALFDKGPREVPLIGKVVSVGMADEITDRAWVIVVDGRVHYADLGRLIPVATPQRGMIAALAGGHLDERPNKVPRPHVLSPVPSIICLTMMGRPGSTRPFCRIGGQSRACPA